jgi:hypothetical protein
VADTPLVGEVETPVGVARTVSEGTGGRTLVLGHGAGGGVDAPDLLAARDAGLAAGLRVVRVEQPWRVQGHSAGARVACRTAAATGALGVLALAFPLHPPGRPDRSRLAELQLPEVPRLVVQGARDAFGVPEPEPGVEVHVVAGADHGFAVRRKDGRTAEQVAAEVRRVVAAWLQTLT